MNTSTPLRIAMALFLLAFSVDCARRTAHREEAAPDDSKVHYQQGQRYLNQEKFQEAVEQFKMALALDPDFVPSYEGLGLAQLGLGQLSLAQRYFLEGFHKDSTYAPLHIGLGRLLSAQGNDQDALGRFQRALELDPGSADAFYYMAKSYVNLGKYSQAEECFKKTLDRDPGHIKASQDWAKLARQRTSPQDVPQEYVLIVKKPVISRADFAALLARQLPLQNFCESREGEISPVDIEESWASREILQVVACDLMPVFADGEFKPRQSITRLQCAVAIKEVLVKATGDSQLAQQYDGHISPFVDVSAVDDAFGAVMLATTRGIMEAKADGSFGPGDVINGYTATRIVRALKGQL